jgi:hypothetical protein
MCRPPLQVRRRLAQRRKSEAEVERLIVEEVSRVKGITFDTVREIGLTLLRAQEGRYYGMPALKVDGEVFAVQTIHRGAEPNSISVRVGFEKRERLIAADPTVFYLKRHYAPDPVVLVRLDCITREDLQNVVRVAYEAVSSGSVRAGRQRGARRQKSSTKIIRRKRSR